MVANKRFDLVGVGVKPKAQAASEAHPSSKAWTVDDCVCPACSSKLQCPNVTPGKADRYDRIIREVFGWCFECAAGFAFFQFKNNGRWLTNKYREYFEGETEGQYCSPGPWKVLYELPEPSPVVLGVGGDYDTAIDLDERTLKILERSTNIIGSVFQALTDMVMAMRKKKA